MSGVSPAPGMIRGAGRSGHSGQDSSRERSASGFGGGERVQGGRRCGLLLVVRADGAVAGGGKMQVVRKGVMRERRRRE